MSVEQIVSGIVDVVSGWEGVSVGSHRFGGQEFNLGNVEIGHIHSIWYKPGWSIEQTGSRRGKTPEVLRFAIHRSGMVDIPLPRRVRDQLVAEGKAGPHHLLPKTGWITVFARTEVEVEPTMWLLKLSYLQKRLRRSRHDPATTNRLLEGLDELNLSQALRRVI